MKLPRRGRHVVLSVRQLHSPAYPTPGRCDWMKVNPVPSCSSLLAQRKCRPRHPSFALPPPVLGNVHVVPKLLQSLYIYLARRRISFSPIAFPSLRPKRSRSGPMSLLRQLVHSILCLRPSSSASPAASPAESTPAKMTAIDAPIEDVFIGSIDQGTTSSRFLIFNREGVPVASHQIEFAQHYPHSGYVCDILRARASSGGPLPNLC